MDVHIWSNKGVLFALDSDRIGQSTVRIAGDYTTTRVRLGIVGVMFSAMSYGPQSTNIPINRKKDMCLVNRVICRRQKSYVEIGSERNAIQQAGGKTIVTGRR